MSTAYTQPDRSHLEKLHMNTRYILNDLDKREKLTALWLFVFLNMIFRDLHQLGHPGFIEEIMSGTVNGVQVTDSLLLIGGIMIAVPLLIIPLTQFLGVKASRVATFASGCFTS